ncbi:MAG: hypothetical protein A2X64_09375 [Ignavibacteria bacterium GWF2_33_9]|nr:MAG: hypothetical protein A2X64_09375 [Ignavibacteria bacterium GWF2_33_9]
MPENINIIKCPNCSAEINVENVIYKQAEEKIKSSFEKQQKQQIAILLSQKEALEQEKVRFEELKQKENDLFNERLQKEKFRLKDELSKSLKDEMELEMKSLSESLEKKNEENKLLKSKEIELLRKENELNSKMSEVNLEIERKLLEQKNKIEKDAQSLSQQNMEMLKNQFNEMLKEKEADYKQELQKKDLQLDQQKKLAEEMRKKAEQGSMQLQGEAQEIILENTLKLLYPFDDITPVPTGYNGADVIQHVKNQFNANCGSIIYESKKAINWSEDWIRKLKDDQTKSKSAFAILVTRVFPAGMNSFGERNGVWVCGINDYQQISFILRDMIIKEFEVIESQKNSGDKMVQLYNYLTGSDFKMRIQNILDAFTSMQNQLQKEKRAFEKIWKEREVHISRVITNTIQLHSTFTGIAGNAMPELEGFALDTLTEDEESETN